MKKKKTLNSNLINVNNKNNNNKNVKKKVNFGLTKENDDNLENSIQKLILN